MESPPSPPDRFSSEVLRAHRIVDAGSDKTMPRLQRRFRVDGGLQGRDLSGERAAWTVRHGLRTLVKKGNPEALTLLGATCDADVRVLSFDVEPKTVGIGESVRLTVTLELPGTTPADVVVEYRVHYTGVRGTRGPKVFKWTRRKLQPGKPETLTKTHRSRMCPSGGSCQGPPDQGPGERTGRKNRRSSRTALRHFGRSSEPSVYRQQVC